MRYHVRRQLLAQLAIDQRPLFLIGTIAVAHDLRRQYLFTGRPFDRNEDGPRHTVYLTARLHCGVYSQEAVVSTDTRFDTIY